MSPIASSYPPYLRVGPVPYPLMIIDSRTSWCPGSTGLDLDLVRPRVVAMADRAFEAVWSVSPRRPAGEEPLLTPRMVTIAFLLADGRPTGRSAASSGISERTVSTEVREIGRRLGTTNRSHTIARICGAPL